MGRFNDVWVSLLVGCDGDGRICGGGWAGLWMGQR